MMTPSRAATAALDLTSTFNAQDSADGAILSTVLSFDLLSLPGIGNRPIAIGGKKRKLQHISIKVIGPHADKTATHLLSLCIRMRM